MNEILTNWLQAKKRTCTKCGVGPFVSRAARHEHYTAVHCKEGMSKRKRRDTKGHASPNQKKRALAQAA